jgi:hypothetical protein
MNVIEALRSRSGKNLYHLYSLLLQKLAPIDYGHYQPVDWQYDDWVFMDNHDDVCLCRAPGGSKTFDCVQWMVLQKVLHPDWDMAWLASHTGELTQARIYFEQHPFVKEIRRVHGYERIYLKGSESFIHFRSATKTIAGIRLDVILLDEEEMLDPHQVEIVYPQLDARMTASSVAKFIHVGTMQYRTKFLANTEEYPTSKHTWEECPWLVKAGKIQQMIDNGVHPQWEIDMLYYCIPTSPGGALLHNLQQIDEIPNKSQQAGLDFGKEDVCIGVVIKDNDCYVVFEEFRDLGQNYGAFDFLKGMSVEVEAGGYNDQEKHHAKAKVVQNRVGGHRQSWNHGWAERRVMRARAFKNIYVDPQKTPRIWKELREAQWDPSGDGTYYKHKTKAPCHLLDAFMHAIHSQRPSYTRGTSMRRRRQDILLQEKRRNSRKGL